MWKAVLFDLDGTLTDSAEGITKSVQYALDAFGMHVENLSDLNQFVGPPLHEQFMQFANMNGQQAEYAVEKYRERFSTVGIYENYLYPGIEQVLQQLKSQGIYLAVASAKPQVFVNQILEYFHLTQYFDVVVGSELNGFRSHKTEIIEEAIRQMNLGGYRRDIVMVGDRGLDMQAAKNCGIAALGAAYGYGGKVELLTNGADRIVDSVDELMQFFIEQPSQEMQEPYSYEQYLKKQNIFLKLWRMGYPVLIHFAALVLASTIGSIAISIIYAGILGYTDVTEIMNRVIYFTVLLTGVGEIISLPLLGYFFKKDESFRRNIPRRPIFTGFHGFSPLMLVVLFIFSWCLGQLLGDLISILGLPELFPSYSELSEQVFEGQNLIISLLSVGILAPLAEELTFRGLLYKRIKDYWGYIPAVILSALAFGAYHGNMIQFIFAAILGIVFAIIYEKTNSLWAPIICHMGVNIASTIMQEVYVSTGVYIAIKVAELVILVVTGVYLILKLKKKPVVIEPSESHTEM